MPPDVLDRFRQPSQTIKSELIDRRDQLKETREQYLDKIREIDAELEDLNAELI